MAPDGSLGTTKVASMERKPGVSGNLILEAQNLGSHIDYTDIGFYRQIKR